MDKNEGSYNLSNHEGKRLGKAYKTMVKSLSSDPNLHFILTEDDVEKAIPKLDLAQVEMILKKSTLYAAHTIVLLRPVAKFLDVYGKNFNGPDVYGPLDERIKHILMTVEDSKFKDFFHIVPRAVATWGEDHEDDRDEDTSYVQYEFSFESEYTNRFGLYASLADPAQNTHILESLRCSSQQLTHVNVWLPELQNISLETLLKVRNDEGDSFLRFQHTLRSFLGDLKDLDSDQKVKEVFQKVDYEVRSFESKMQSLAKMRSLKALEAIVGSCVVGLCMAIPSEVTAIISAIIGAYKGKDFIDYLFRKKEEADRLKTSNFYIPWLCTKLSEKNY